MLTYFAVLLWRFVGLLLFSIHSTDCFFREKVASYRCKNFTLFSHAKEMEIAWQMASVVNTLLVILVLSKVPGYEGYMSALRNNSKHARFWSLFCQLIGAVVYNIIVITTESLGISKFIEVGFIFGEVFTTLLVYLWNTVPAPWKEPRVPAQHLFYMLTLIVFILENFYLFMLVSTQAAFQITGVDNFRQTPSELQAIILVLNAAEATFYFAIMKFFWNKLFDDRRNLLINDNV